MADPAWPCSTPETNYLRLVGPGAAGTATTVASGAAWQALAATNEAVFAASMFNTANTALNFEGVGGTSSTAAVTGLNAALQLLAGWAQEKPPIVASAIAAYETAVSTMIPAEVSLANRTEQAANVALNPAVFGALTPAIVTLDTEYFGEHWPHNSGAGAAYGAALAALVAALAIPPPLAPLGASPTAQLTAASAAAQAAGTAAMSGASNSASQLGQAPLGASAGVGQLSAAMQPMQSALGALQPMFGMFSAPMQAFQGLASMPQSMLGSFGGLFTGMKAPDASVPGVDTVRSTGAPAGGISSTPTNSANPTAGGYPGAGLTSYTRPTSSFQSESAGRPVNASHGLLSTDMRGPTSSAGGVPLSPASAGVHAPRGGAASVDSKGEVAMARVALLQNDSAKGDFGVK